MASVGILCIGSRGLVCSLWDIIGDRKCVHCYILVALLLLIIVSEIGLYVLVILLEIMY